MIIVGAGADLISTLLTVIIVFLNIEIIV